MAMYGNDESLGERLEDKYQELKERISGDEHGASEAEQSPRESFGERIDGVPPELEEEMEADNDINDRVI